MLECNHLEMIWLALILGDEGLHVGRHYVEILGLVRCVVGQGKVDG